MCTAVTFIPKQNMSRRNHYKQFSLADASEHIGAHVLVKKGWHFGYNERWKELILVIGTIILFAFVFAIYISEITRRMISVLCCIAKKRNNLQERPSHQHVVRRQVFYTGDVFQGKFTLQLISCRLQNLLEQNKTMGIRRQNSQWISIQYRERERDWQLH